MQQKGDEVRTCARRRVRAQKCGYDNNVQSKGTVLARGDSASLPRAQPPCFLSVFNSVPPNHHPVPPQTPLGKQKAQRILCCDFLASGHPLLFFCPLASNKQTGKACFSYRVNSFNDEISVERLKHAISCSHCEYAPASESRW